MSNSFLFFIACGLLLVPALDGAVSSFKKAHCNVLRKASSNCQGEVFSGRVSPAFVELVNEFNCTERIRLSNECDFTMQALEGDCSADVPTPLTDKLCSVVIDAIVRMYRCTPSGSPNSRILDADSALSRNIGLALAEAVDEFDNCKEILDLKAQCVLDLDALKKCRDAAPAP